MNLYPLYIISHTQIMGTENAEMLVEPTDSSMAVAISSGSRAGRARILRWITVFECHQSFVGLLFLSVHNCSMEFLYRRNVMAYGVPNSFQWCNLGSFLIRQVVIDVQGKSVSWLQKCRRLMCGFRTSHVLFVSVKCLKTLHSII